MGSRRCTLAGCRRRIERRVLIGQLRRVTGAFLACGNHIDGVEGSAELLIGGMIDGQNGGGEHCWFNWVKCMDHTHPSLISRVDDDIPLVIGESGEDGPR